MKDRPQPTFDFTRTARVLPALLAVMLAAELLTALRFLGTAAAFAIALPTLAYVWVQGVRALPSLRTLPLYPLRTQLANAVCPPMLLLPASTAIKFEQPDPSGLPLMWAFSAIFASVAITLLGLHARTRTAPSCPDCRYPAAGLTPPFTCPECACHIATPAMLSTEQRRRRPAIILTGVTLFVTACVAAKASFSVPNLTTRLFAPLPDAVLIRAAAESGDIFQALDLPSLTPAQRDDLITRTLDARTAETTGADVDLYLQLVWLNTEWAAGRLSPEQSDRYLFEGFDLRIDAAPRPRLNRDTKVTLDLASPRPAIGAAPTTVLVLEFRVGDTDHADPTTPHAPGAVGRGAQFSPSTNSVTSSDPPTATIHPTTTDPVPVHARVLLVVTPPSKTPPTVTLNPDGSPSVSPEPIATRELTADALLTVAP